MTQIDIRPTRAEDIPALQTLARDTGLFPPEMLPELLAPALADDPEVLWLTGVQDGAVAGLCFAKQEALAEGCWNMLALAVCPTSQRRGLGAALVQALEQVLRDAGQRLLIVETSGTAEFAGARHFYAARDYQEEARIRDFWAAGDDKVTFRKALQ